MSPPQALIPWCVDKRRSSLPGRYLSSHRDMWYPLTVHSWHNHQLTTMRSEIFPDVSADTAELFSVLLPSILTPSQSVTTWTGESNWNEIKQARSPSPRVAPATYPITYLDRINMGPLLLLLLLDVTIIFIERMETALWSYKCISFLCICCEPDHHHQNHKHF